jgi:hypothetical protein
MKAKNILKSDSMHGMKAGTCLTCLDSYLLCEHRAEERSAEQRVSKAVAKCVESLKAGNLQRIASRHELESDEFSTAFQKALELV